MAYEIITDRFEIEKLTEDIYLSDDQACINIDSADIRTLRRVFTLKYGISCKVSFSNDRYIEEILAAIKSSDIPISDLKTCLIHIRINKNEQALNFKNLCNLLQQILNIKADNRSECYPDVMLAIYTNSSIPLRECYINIIFGVNKTDEDKLEDEKYEQMIEEYRESKLPPMPELPCITL